MSYQAFRQLQAQAHAIGIFTAGDLFAFYEHEKQDGEGIGATVARYAAELLSD